MRDTNAPSAARYMLEIHDEDELHPRHIEIASGITDLPIVTRDEGATAWIYCKTMTEMIDLLSDFARCKAVHAYPHRRRDVERTILHAGVEYVVKEVHWEYRWYAE